MRRAFLPFLSLLFLACSVQFPLKVIEVVDGDTVRLSNGKILRYIGVDAPEIRIREEKGFLYKPQPFALEAREFNRKLVENKPVRLELDIEKMDRYGRLLAYCFVDDIFVNAELLKEGYAVLYTKPPNLKYQDLFVRLQKEARQQKKGLWGAYEVISEKEAHLYINQIRTVRGKVLKTRQSKRCIFLNFGQDYKKDFTVVIFKENLKYFFERGIDPLNFYKGKIVEVTGKIREYNGLEIIVSYPAEINVINFN